MNKRIQIIILVSALISVLILSGCAGIDASAAVGDQIQARNGNRNLSAAVDQQPAGQIPESEVGNGRRGQGQTGAGRTQSAGMGSGIAREPLSEQEVQALIRAIEEEYGAQALYQSILDTFGDVAPFNRIVVSESQHITALVRQAEKYGVSIPEPMDSYGISPFETLEEACQAGVEAEIADAALYDELSPMVSHSDILQVFDNLKSASLDSHLPAFEACQ
jgi:hypothetical protein